MDKLGLYCICMWDHFAKDMGSNKAFDPLFYSVGSRYLNHG